MMMPAICSSVGLLSTLAVFTDGAAEIEVGDRGVSFGEGERDVGTDRKFRDREQRH